MATSFDDFNGKEMSSAIYCQPPALALCFVFVCFFVAFLTIRSSTINEQRPVPWLAKLEHSTTRFVLNGRQMSMSGGMAVQVFQFQVNFAGFSFFQAGISSLTSCAGETNDYTGCSLQVNKSPPWHLIWFHSSSRFNGKTDPHFHPINFFWQS
jgi:hypothetical protein